LAGAADPLAVKCAKDFLTDQFEQLRALTGTRFLPELTYYWQTACYRVMGSLTRGGQRAMRHQLVHHLATVAAHIQYGQIGEAITQLAAIDVPRGRGKFRGRAPQRLPALLPHLRAITPLLTSADGWLALETLWRRVFEHALVRLPLGLQRALLDQLGGHLWGVRHALQHRKTPAMWITRTLPAPRLTDQRGHYTRPRTTPTFVAPDGWTPTTKTRPQQATPDLIDLAPFLGFPEFPPLAPKVSQDLVEWVESGHAIGPRVYPGKLHQRIPLLGLVDEYDRIMQRLIPLLAHRLARRGWKRLRGRKQRTGIGRPLCAMLQGGFPAIAERRWEQIMGQAAVPHPDALDYSQLNRELPALAIVGELYHLNPQYLRTTLLPRARLMRRPWPEQRA
jgi:hypothetical protein